MSKKLLVSVFIAVASVAAVAGPADAAVAHPAAAASTVHASVRADQPLIICLPTKNGC